MVGSIESNNGEAAQIANAIELARSYGLISPSMEQPMYNLFTRRKVELDLILLCRSMGIGLTTFSPFFFGLLTGKYNNGIPADSRANMDGDTETKDAITPQRVEKVRLLAVLAKELGITTAQLSIAYLLSAPEGGTVIMGASRISQLDENLKAAGLSTTLIPEVLERLTALLGLATLE